ncbi:MAG: hypothetical protein PVH88_10255 [Ignavibacteria bacterium]|jgi:hypothetical protein
MSKTTILVTIIALILCVNIYGQSKANTVSISKSKLIKIVNDAGTNHIMFNIKKRQLYILDARRNALLPKRYRAPHNEVYTVYTVIEVLNKVEQTTKRKIKLYKNENGAVKFDIDTEVSTKSLVLTSEVDRFCPPGCSGLD